MSKKYCSIYQYDENLIIISSQKTKNGIQEVEPYYIIPKNSESNVIGEKVRIALSNFKEFDELVSDPNLSNYIGLKATKLKTYKKFIMSTSLCEVIETDSNITIRPTRNGGYSGDSRGFNALREKEIVLDKTATHEEIGEKVLNAFTVCE